MIIIGEKINGAVPAVKKAIANRDGDWIRKLAQIQVEAGTDYIDCAPSTETEQEYDCMCWLIDEIQAVTEVPICIDSPNAKLLARVIDDGYLSRPGILNSVSAEGDKCDTIFPLISGTDWQVIVLACNNDGIPNGGAAKIEILKRIIDKAINLGVELHQIHIDPCIMSLPTVPSSMQELAEVYRSIRMFAPEVKLSGAVSNISYGMPCRRYVNAACMAYAVEAGMQSAICDPCNSDLIGTIFAAEALCLLDRGGRKYNRAYRQGRFGQKKVQK